MTRYLKIKKGGKFVADVADKIKKTLDKSANKKVQVSVPVNDNNVKTAQAVKMAVGIVQRQSEEKAFISLNLFAPKGTRNDINKTLAQGAYIHDKYIDPIKAMINTADWGVLYADRQVYTATKNSHLNVRGALHAIAAVNKNNKFRHIDVSDLLVSKEIAKQENTAPATQQSTNKTSEKEAAEQQDIPAAENKPDALDVFVQKAMDLNIFKKNGYREYTGANRKFASIGEIKDAVKNKEFFQKITLMINARLNSDKSKAEGALGLSADELALMNKICKQVKTNSTKKQDIVNLVLSIPEGSRSDVMTAYLDDIAKNNEGRANKSSLKAFIKASQTCEQPELEAQA